jgi:hypothetical protein
MGPCSLAPRSSWVSHSSGRPRRPGSTSSLVGSCCRIVARPLTDGIGMSFKMITHVPFVIKVRSQSVIFSLVVFTVTRFWPHSCSRADGGHWCHRQMQLSWTGGWRHASESLSEGGKPSTQSCSLSPEVLGSSGIVVCSIIARRRRRS